LTMATVPLPNRLVLLIGIMMLLGAAESTLDVSANTLLVWLHGERVRPFMNGLHSCFGIGALLAPAIVAFMVFGGRSITDTYFMVAVVTFPVTIWLLRLPAPRQRGTSGDNAPTAFNRQLVRLIAIFLLLYVGAEIGFAGWIFTYVTTIEPGATTRGAYLTSVFWAALTVGRLLAIPLTARLSLGTVLAADVTGSLLSVVALWTFSHSPLGLLLGTVGLGLAMATIFPSTMALAGQEMKITGRITGWFLVGASIGAMTVPWLIGPLFEFIGPHAVMLTLVVTLTLAAATLAVLLSQVRRLASRSEAVTEAQAGPLIESLFEIAG
jgi:MFS transporter, FHS family, Na+ dependent glucose transporter 1